MVTRKTAAPPERAYRGVGIAQRKAERRARLLQAAIQCFGRDGYHATTLKALCAEAGLTERYFYESFTNFDEILCSCYQHAAETIFSIVSADIARAQPDPISRLRAALKSYFKVIADDPARAHLTLIEIVGASDSANQAYRTQLGITVDVIRLEIFKELLPNPGNGLSLQILATAMMGAAYQLAKEWVLSDFKLPRATLLRNLEAVAAGIINQWQRAPAAAASAGKSKRNLKTEL